jgi:hypothetical protein
VTSLHFKFTPATPSAHFEEFRHYSFPKLIRITLDLQLTEAVLSLVGRSSQFLRELRTFRYPWLDSVHEESFFVLPELQHFSGASVLGPMLLTESPLRSLSTDIVSIDEDAENFFGALKKSSETLDHFYFGHLEFNPNFMEIISRYLPRLLELDYMQNGIVTGGEMEDILVSHHHHL